MFYTRCHNHTDNVVKHSVRTMAKHVLSASCLLTPSCFSISFYSPAHSTLVVTGDSECVLRNADSDETALVSDY
jgi:hypothetical protein